MNNDLIAANSSTMQILVINALNGVFPLVLRKKYPHARITCAEIFPFYKHHLRSIGFEVMDWDDVVDMKFDIIVGNPPYQSADSTMSLWPLFVEKSMKMLVPHGHLAMVTPATWMRPSNDIKRPPKQGGSKQIFRDIMQSYNTKVIDTGHAKKYFDVGSTITWYLIENTSYAGSTNIIDPQGNQTNIDLRKYHMFPINADVVSLKIIEKLQTPDLKFNFKGIQGPGKADLEYQSNKTTKFKYLYIGGQYSQKNFDKNRECVVYYSSKKHPDHHKPKIIINYIGDIKPYVDDGNAGMQYCQVHYLDNAAQVAPAISVVKSGLWQFAYKFIRYGMHNEKGPLNSLGHPPLTQVYSNQEVYDYYGLTPSEIAHVESNL